MRRWLRRRHDTDLDEEGEGREAERKRSGWYLRFARQELRGWSPILKGRVVVLYLLAVAVLLIALGVPILTASTGIVEYYVRYDDQGSLSSLNSTQREQALQIAGDNGVSVAVSFTVNKTMHPPVRQSCLSAAAGCDGKTAGADGLKPLLHVASSASSRNSFPHDLIFNTVCLLKSSRANCAAQDITLCGPALYSLCCDILQSNISSVLYRYICTIVLEPSTKTISGAALILAGRII